MASTVGSLFVEIATKGFDKVKEQLSSVRSQFEKTQGDLSAIKAPDVHVPVVAAGVDKAQAEIDKIKPPQMAVKPPDVQGAVDHIKPPQLALKAPDTKGMK